MSSKPASELKDKKISVFDALTLNQYEMKSKEQKKPKTDDKQWQHKLYQLLQSNFLDNSSLGTSQEERIFQQQKDLDFLI